MNTRAIAAWPVLLGTAFAALAVDRLHRRAPHEHSQNGDPTRSIRVWWFTIATFGVVVGVLVMLQLDAWLG